MRERRGKESNLEIDTVDDYGIHQTACRKASLLSKSPINPEHVTTGSLYTQSRWQQLAVINRPWVVPCSSRAGSKMSFGVNRANSSHFRFFCGEMLTVGISALQYRQRPLPVVLKKCIALHGISELRSVTCHMGSHSVTCHPTQVSAPRPNPSHAGRYSIYLPRRDGRLSLPCYLETQPPGV